MNFDLTEDQRLVIDAVSRYLTREYSLAERAAATSGNSRHWQALAEQGMFALPFEERYGGGGGGWNDVALVMQEFGKALVNEPYLASIVFPGALIQAGASELQKQEMLPRIIDGSVRFAVAYEEVSSAYDPTRIDTTFSEAEGEGGYVLNGRKKGILAGNFDVLIVLARRGDDFRLFMVPTGSPGVGLVTHPSVDGAAVSEATFGNVRVPADALLGDGRETLRHLELALDIARIGLCAEAVGIMESMIRDTAEYARTRKQFGVPIGSFQALQHKLVDMFVHTEQAKSSVWRALAYVDDEAGRAQACASAKALVGIGARFVGQQAIQIHGGMGMTEEMGISHFFRRLTAIEQTLGNAAYHLRRVARQVSREPALN
ncbi:acyl-CoA dehydrogenase family protein [Cupriavidus sp. D39]|uniref:acyl-CoA dehydrogenase family protein n=1 Tax=Cupriavidus sp. D39 TaxID=2997877 RepID=UPI00226F30C3|nr:acyl-CoA dehydrogenase family protein [Cupriavidus sp. D39]MCY0854887.1 acyl-CoA dehydrogenase family protein [Cupriavidus sp. D39]